MKEKNQERESAEDRQTDQTGAGSSLSEGHSGVTPQKLNSSQFLSRSTDKQMASFNGVHST